MLFVMMFNHLEQLRGLFEQKTRIKFKRCITIEVKQQLFADDLNAIEDDYKEAECNSVQAFGQDGAWFEVFYSVQSYIKHSCSTRMVVSVTALPSLHGTQSQSKRASHQKAMSL